MEHPVTSATYVTAELTIGLARRSGTGSRNVWESKPRSNNWQCRLMPFTAIPTRSSCLAESLLGVQAILLMRRTRWLPTILMRSLDSILIAAFVKEDVSCQQDTSSLLNALGTRRTDVERANLLLLGLTSKGCMDLDRANLLLHRHRLTDLETGCTERANLLLLRLTRPWDIAPRYPQVLP